MYLLTEHHLAGENPNWTEVLGSVAVVLNLQSVEEEMMFLHMRQSLVRYMIILSPVLRKRRDAAGPLMKELG